MKRSAVLAVGLAAVATVTTTSFALATVPEPVGISQTQADAACAGVLDLDEPAGLQAAIDVYNTVDNTDDAPFSAIPAPWQAFVIASEDHLDYQELAGQERIAFTCEAGVAVGLYPEPVTPPTATPPTTEPASTTAPGPTLNPDTDDDFDQVGTPPAGGVDTGAR